MDNPRCEIVALSGGKDSTAMALRLAEVEPGTPRVYLCTPTGNELPAMLAHWARLEELIGAPIQRVSNGTLLSWIEHWSALPNGRQRWCTRVLKIEPTLAFVRRRPGSTMCVGLRADEETRTGIYSDDVKSRFPLREWGWGLSEVQAYLHERGIAIPPRTDCAWCYGQRLGEWYDLWRQEPDLFAAAEDLEERTGHTFRSASRDTWPAALSGLASEFSRGRVPRGARLQLRLFDAVEPCRVCRL